MALVLLWEDDVMLGQMLGELLADEGHCAVMCASSEEQLQHAAKLPHALAITDSQGRHTASPSEAERQRLATLAALVPTILTSGRAWANDDIARELGLVAAVQKPFDLTDLLQAIEAASARIACVELAASSRA